jgi:hypothetical protein
MGSITIATMQNVASHANPIFINNLCFFAFSGEGNLPRTSAVAESTLALSVDLYHDISKSEDQL